MAVGRSRAFEISADPHPKVGRTAQERIKQSMASKTDQLAEGVAGDFAQYRFRVGQISGLLEALVLIQEAEREDS